MTGVASDSLRQELASLRRGRGVRSRLTPADLGPQLRRLCGLTLDDDPASVSRKLTGELRILISQLPPDLQEAANAAFGMHPDAPRLLQARVAQLAATLPASRRTAFRRIDAAVRLMADAATARAPTSRPRTPSDGWITDEVRDLMRFETHVTEVLQERRILATYDDIGRLAGAFGLPSGAAAGEPEVLFGGVMATVERRGTLVRYVVELPHRLERGESHRYALRYRLPTGQPSAPHYILTPLTPVRHFELRVRFEPARLPVRVWCLNGVLPREVDDPDAGEALQLDSAGEITVAFHNVRPGWCHGAAWRWDDAEGSSDTRLGMAAH